AAHVATRGRYFPLRNGLVRLNLLVGRRQRRENNSGGPRKSRHASGGLCLNPRASSSAPARLPLRPRQGEVKAVPPLARDLPGALAEAGLHEAQAGEQPNRCGVLGIDVGGEFVVVEGDEDVV